MKTISVVTPCYNEEGNVREVYERVRNLFLSLGKYRYEHIFIDNASRDTHLRRSARNRCRRLECQSDPQCAQLRPRPLADARSAADHAETPSSS